MPNYRRWWVPGGSYFFTVNLHDRSQRLLVDHVGLLRAAFRYVRHRYPFRIDAIVVLPDHLHTVWKLPHDDDDFALRWRLIKSFFSRGLTRFESRNASRDRRRERGVWQRRFWEHVIRDETDFIQHVDYVHFNPVKHGLVVAPIEWPYSSIHAYVRRGQLPRDWGTSGISTTLELD